MRTKGTSRKITKPIALQPLNTLTVQVRSAPGSSLVVTVFAQTPTVAEALPALEAAGKIPVLDRSTSILGPDVDGDGVRDDIEQYINSLFDTAQQKAALRQESKAIAKAIEAGNSPNATPSQLKDVGTGLGRAVNCIWDRYDTASATSKVTSIEKLMVNTRARFDAYEIYNAKRSGSSSRLLRGDTCDAQ